MTKLASLEICAGAGGQALGLERAGFDHTHLVEIEPAACATLRANRPHWAISQGDVRNFSGRAFRGIDLLAGGVPCPPFSKAGQQLGEGDERDLFPEALRLADECRPRAVMLENVRGLLDPAFAAYRARITGELGKIGYVSTWRLLNACDYGVSQLRPRVLMVALQHELADDFEWPEPQRRPPVHVGDLLHDLMAARGWHGADAWRKVAASIAPTLVGGSKKHGGPDLGPTRARLAWAGLGVDGKGLADMAPDPDFSGMPRLTVKMAARLQGFPDEWAVSGKKTAAYRQVGNAFPPPVAAAVGAQIAAAILAGARRRLRRA